MIKRVLAVGLTIGLAAAVLTSCGSSKTGVPVSTGTVFSFLGDAPLCDVLTFRATITGMTLTPFGGGSPVTVISSTSAFIKVNFAELRDFSTVLNLASVPAGTYDKASIKFSSAQMVVYDPTRSPPLKVITVTLSNSNPTVNVQP